MTAQQLREIMFTYQIDKHYLAMIAGGVSRRTVENWLQGRPMSKPSAKLLSDWVIIRKQCGEEPI